MDTILIIYYYFSINKNGQGENKNRNMGRKPILTEQDKESIKMYRLQGKSLREIAKIYGVSKSLIHNICKI